MKRFSIMFLAAASILTGCSDDDSTESSLGSYTDGVLVLNEGDMQSGTVTFIADDLQTVQQDIFSVVNPGLSTGGYVQSMFFADDRAFIISNMANTITVVNRYTFEFQATISTGMNHPRYATVMDGRAYVTNQASWNTGDDDFITVINLSNLQVENQIPVYDYVERIVSADGKLYVANGAFGIGDSIRIIDVASGDHEEVIVGTAPNSLEIYNGTLYVLCSTMGGTGKLVRMDLADTSHIETVELPSTILSASNLDIEDGNAYFTSASKVYKVAVDADEVNDTHLFDTLSASPYIGYGFGVKDGRVYVCEASADFSSDGKVFIFDTSGEFISQFPTGLGPNGVYFN